MCCELSVEDKEFLVNLTRKSETEVENYYKVFLVRYPTGKIEMTDFVKMVKEHFEKITHQTSDAELLCKFVLKAYDSEKNASMSFREAAHAIYVAKEDAPIKEKIKYSFGLYDYNKNGAIDKKEFYDCMLGLMKALGEKNMEEYIEEVTQDMMADIDIDTRDNMITEDEFSIAAKSEFLLSREGLCRIPLMIGQILQEDLILIGIAEEFKTVLSVMEDCLEKSLNDILFGFVEEGLKLEIEPSENLRNWKITIITGIGATIFIGAIVLIGISATKQKPR